MKPGSGEDVSILNRTVAYNINDMYGLEIPKHIGIIPQNALTTISGKDYIYGAVSKQKKDGCI